jgi:hypothetical protein
LRTVQLLRGELRLAPDREAVTVADPGRPKLARSSGPFVSFPSVRRRPLADACGAATTTPVTKRETDRSSCSGRLFIIDAP